MSTPHYSEVVLALKDDSLFQSLFKKRHRFFRAVKKYPDLKDSLFQKTLSSSDLFCFIICDNAAKKYHNLRKSLFKEVLSSSDLFKRIFRNYQALHNILIYNEDLSLAIINKLIQCEDIGYIKKIFESLNQLISFTKNHPQTKEAITKFTLENEELRNHLISTRSCLEKFIQAFPERTEQIADMLYDQNILRTYLNSVADVEYFLKEFPGLGVLFPGVLKNYSDSYCMKQYCKVEDFVQLMTRVFPESADSFFDELMTCERLFLNLFYNYLENHLAKFYEGVKLFPEQYQARVWEKAIIYFSPRLLNKALETGDVCLIDLTTELAAKAIQCKVLSREAARSCQQSVLAAAENGSRGCSDVARKKLFSLNTVLQDVLFPLPPAKTITKNGMLVCSTPKGEAPSLPNGNYPVRQQLIPSV